MEWRAELTGRVPTVWVDGDALYRAHAERLHRLAFLLTGSDETAGDLVHDVFARAHHKASRADNPGAYLRTAVVNAANSHHRRARLARERTPTVPTEAWNSELVEFRDLLLQLTPRQRAAVVLRYFCDLPDREIAAALRCQEATVRSLIHRALHELREVLRDGDA